MDCQLVGRWRIVAADLREGGALDPCGPAMLDIRADGHGEIAFGTLQANLDLACGHVDVAFDRAADDGSIEIEFDCHRDDDAILKAVRDTSSAACALNWTC